MKIFYSTIIQREIENNEGKNKKKKIEIFFKVITREDILEKSKFNLFKDHDSINLYSKVMAINNC